MSATIQVDRVESSRLQSVDWTDVPFGRVFADHMLVSNFADGQWGQMRIRPYGPMRITPAISSLHYGQSIFEGLKAHRGVDGKVRVFRPEANFERMCLSAERLCMPVPTEEIFLEGLRALIEVDEAWVPHAEGYSLYIRPFMYATDEYVGIRPSDTYRFVIFSCPVAGYYSHDVKVKVSDKYVRAFPHGTGAAKFAGNYAAAMLGMKEARDEGFDQVIWLDGMEMKYVEESGTMNLFFVIDNTLITPSTEGTILQGVTRDSLLTLARDAGYKVEERRIAITEVVTAHEEGRLQEAFGAGTAATIAHISEIGFEGRHLVLPGEEGRSISNALHRTLDEIKNGARPDPYGWVTVI